MTSRKRTLFLALLCAILLAALALGPAAIVRLRALSVLARFSSPQDSGLSTAFARGPFSEELGSAETPGGPLRYRLYRPTTPGRHPGIVLLHGVHHLGIDEPRLTAFSRALAGAGIEVLTPELQDLADFRVTSRTIDQIGASAGLLCRLTGRSKAGLLGLSFAGGLALLAADNPAYAPRIAFVVAIGAHDDLSRVARFFATNRVEEPDGLSTCFPAHEYGVLVLVYARLQDFFSSPDVPLAREALRLWLWEQPEASRKAALLLSPAGQLKFDLLLHHREKFRDELLREIEAHQPELRAVSPHGRMASLTVPVFILHGAGDTVIPAAESLWLAREIPREKLRDVLISPALIHVSVESGVSLAERWALIDFLAQVVEAAREERNSSDVQKK
ncbi:MAG: alpha/beta hydrolase [Acidobacteriia bacterium]|nr:alpha/beta hydrolase [Terriglobia bacterium]